MILMLTDFTISVSTRMSICGRPASRNMLYKLQSILRVNQNDLGPIQGLRKATVRNPTSVVHMALPSLLFMVAHSGEG